MVYSVRLKELKFLSVILVFKAFLILKLKLYKIISSSKA